MTSPDLTELGTAAPGPEIDDEPLLVRPYVRLREHAERPADEGVSGPPPSAGQPESHDRPAATPDRTGPARSGRRIGSALTRHASAVHRSRRHLLAVGSGTLILLLGTTALVLAFGDQPAAPAADVGGAAAPKGSHFATGTVPAPPPSPVSNPPSTAGASGPPPGSVLPSGSVLPPRPSGGTQPSVPAVLDEQPTPLQPPPADPRTGRITAVSGLCLDGAGGPRADRIRRWDCDGSSGQSWTVAGDGTIQTLGRCLQAAGGQVTLQTCDGGPAQQWRSGSADSLVNPASGLCLSGPDDDASSRGSQRMAACNRSDAQRWTLP
ncbi:ricin-type beta-trefoil lectin domain protein [Dactylosporangium sp. AC04546]|uniref:RICIN domain-containing protein n=1 Tax=Dactylosporangium sp. AC04546 TaxID=2862460 RepID=UPI001EDF2915|nr:RICIN domain-containing protein [Dactylosporangium sp. AC04546]WVK82479.1 ricin-type beta-trefoil lectin domain protein [Dactylosporangium sp. AC04546]